MIYEPPTAEPQLSEVLWQRIGDAKRHLLIVEYDGVLAPYRPERDSAFADETTLATLLHIVQSPSNRVVVIAGRSLHEVEELLRPWMLDIVGEHGWEERAREGDRVIHPLPATAAQRLGQAIRIARASGYDSLLERKRCSVALHTRGLPGWEAEEAEETCRTLWGKTFEREGLRLNPIDCGMELRATQRNEGTVVAEWLDRLGGSLPVYVGTATTGLHAFRRLRGVGVNVQVGGLSRSPLADAWLETEGLVASFLERYASFTS
jgi:trehalose-phosphatase